MIGAESPRTGFSMQIDLLSYDFFFLINAYQTYELIAPRDDLCIDNYSSFHLLRRVLRTLKYNQMLGALLQ